MKQKEFAAYLGVKTTSYSSWVNDNVPPTGDNLHRLALKLGYEIYDIVGETPPQPLYATMLAAQEAYNDLAPEEQAAFLDRINRVIEDTLRDFGAVRLK